MQVPIDIAKRCGLVVVKHERVVPGFVVVDQRVLKDIRLACKLRFSRFVGEAEPGVGEWRGRRCCGAGDQSQAAGRLDDAHQRGVGVGGQTKRRGDRDSRRGRSRRIGSIQQRSLGNRNVGIRPHDGITRHRGSRPVTHPRLLENVVRDSERIEQREPGSIVNIGANVVVGRCATTWARVYPVIFVAVIGEQLPWQLTSR